MSMLEAMRQMSPVEREGRKSGEAGHGSFRDEATNPRHNTESAGSALLTAALTRENLQRA
jgi:hypothetical protein